MRLPPFNLIKVKSRIVVGAWLERLADLYRFTCVGGAAIFIVSGLAVGCFKFWWWLLS